ncbi:MAG: glycosyltransferase family 4 protein [Acidimicrobiales bacterium]
MRVAVTVEQSWAEVPGGAARVTNELLGALAARPELGVDVVGVAARHRRPPPAAWAPPVATIAHLPLPTLAMFEGWHKLRWPPVEHATGPVDVVHGTIIAVPACRAPLVLTVHDLSFLAYPEHFTRRGVRFFRRALKLARREPRLVTCPSQATMNECLAAGFDPDRLRLVPYGVRATPASKADVEEARRRHRLGRPYVLFCGTVEPRKNLPRVIEAFRRADRAGLDLVLAGPQGWNEQIDALLGRLGHRAHALGFVPAGDLGPLYAGATVVVYPSLREGFGLPVLEAMAQGAPVVTSLGTSTEEVAGDAALLVDPLDVDAIAAAITQVVDRPDLAERLADAGRARAATFTWDRTAELMAAVYTEAVDQ